MKELEEAETMQSNDENHENSHQENSTHQEHHHLPFKAIALVVKKTLDANRYATKKTIAQGLLDVALLTANASQLKYVLQVGQKHEFYTLMLTLIVVSIILQVIQGVLCAILGTVLDINKEHQQNNANRANNIIVALNVLLAAVNIVISVFESKDDIYLDTLTTTAPVTTTGNT